MKWRVNLHLAAKVALLTWAYFLYAEVIHQPWAEGLHFEHYIDRAINLTRSVPLGPQDSFYPVGLTYLYAPFMLLPEVVRYHVLAFAQALMMTGIVLLVPYIARQLGAEPGQQKLAFWLTATFYPLIGFLGYFLSEIPFTLCMLGGFSLLLRFWEKKELMSLLAAGMALGAAMNFRTILQLPLVIIVILLIWKQVKPWKSVAVFIGGFALAYSVQVTHCSIALDRLCLQSTNGAANMYLGQLRVNKVLNGPADSLHYFSINLNYPYDETLTPVIRYPFYHWEQGEFLKIVGQAWREYPGRQVMRSVHNVADLFKLVPDWPIRETPSHGRLEVWWRYLLMFPLLFLSLVAVRQKFSRERVLLVLPLLGTVFLAFMTKGEQRYLIPALLPLIPLAVLLVRAPTD